MLIEPHYDPLTLIPPRPGAILGEPAIAKDAMAWFTAEHAGLLAAIRQAGAAGFDTHAWQLAWILSTFFLRKGFWYDHALAQHAALDAARRMGDAAGEAHATRGLALGYARSGRFSEAYPCFQDALRLFGETGDQASQARIHNSLAWLAEREQRLTDALSHARRAFDLFGAAGHPGQALVLNDIGYCHARLGHYQQAISYCERAMAAIREVGERHLGSRHVGQFRLYLSPAR